MLAKLKNLNPKLNILELNSENFKNFGTILPSEIFSDLFDVCKLKPIPENGNIYVASDEELESCDVLAKLSSNYYGEMPVQIGYCNGQNMLINALEYHKSEEINIAVTSFIIFVGSTTQIIENQLSTGDLTCFYVPAGSVFSLCSTSLHFSPCKVLESGFQSVIILPKGTNLPFIEKKEKVFPEDELLFTKNKWLIGHKESVQVRERGAFEGLFGENYCVNYK
ncbi:MAG: DUF4867 family protein [Eubacteriales bacterium]